MLDWVWTGLILVSLVFAVLTGRGGEAGSAALAGGEAAVQLCLQIGGAICLWSGVLKLLEAGGALRGLQRLTRPLLGRLFPEAKTDGAALDALTENLAANLLGLGSAATPAGLRAAQRLRRGDTATDSLCRLAVLNSASVQLIPATVCAVRAGLGSDAPFDILPPVWCASLLALLVGLGAERVLGKLWKG